MYEFMSLINVLLPDVTEIAYKLKTQPHGPFVLAFLFAHPDSDAIRMVDARGDYFDVRTKTQG
jgi:hypothetical protein